MTPSQRSPKRSMVISFTSYKEQFAKYRAKMPDAELAAIARAIGAQWRKLTADQKEKYNKQANQ